MEGKKKKKETWWTKKHYSLHFVVLQESNGCIVVVTSRLQGLLITSSSPTPLPPYPPPPLLSRGWGIKIIRQQLLLFNSLGHAAIFITSKSFAAPQNRNVKQLPIKSDVFDGFEVIRKKRNGRLFFCFVSFVVF